VERGSVSPRARAPEIGDPSSIAVTISLRPAADRTPHHRRWPVGPAQSSEVCSYYPRAVPRFRRRRGDRPNEGVPGSSAHRHLVLASLPEARGGRLWLPKRRFHSSPAARTAHRGRNGMRSESEAAVIAASASFSDSSRQADPVRSDRSGLSLVRQSDDTTTTPSDVQRQADV
jgi:hypothetical protein